LSWLLTKIENILCKIKAMIVFGNTYHHVHFTAKIVFPKNISGNGRLIIGPRCIVNAFGGIELNGEVHMSENSSIYSVGFDTSLYPNVKKHKGSQVVFKGKCWLCGYSMVGPGAVIEDGKIIAPFTLRSRTK
jgi:acetyltransferase-like isoleucine patch superfamily enzyme